MDYEFPVFQTLAVASADLDQYLGVYSSPDFPLKLTFTRDGNTLVGQGTGQPAFPLEPYETDKFKFDSAGLTLEFFPEENKLIVHQGGRAIEMKKE